MLVDVLRYGDPDERDTWTFRAVESGEGEGIVETKRQSVRRRRWLWRTAFGLLLLFASAYGILVAGSLLSTILVDLVILGLAVLTERGDSDEVPELVARDIRLDRAAESYELAERPD